MKIKKILALVLSGLMAFLQMPLSAFAEETEETTPEMQGEYYLLNSADDLYWFSDYVSENQGGKAKLIADITINEGVSFSYDETSGKIKVEKDSVTSYLGSGLSGTKRGEWYGDEIELKEWKPIGSQATGVGYTVEFDGNGHTVDGVYVVGSEQAPFAGFFANLFQEDIKNLTIGEHSLIINNYAATSSGDKGATGGIAAKAFRGDVKNCKNYALVCGAASSMAEWHGGTGGIAGVGASRIAKCENYGIVLGSGSAGGIAGTLVNNSGAASYGNTGISNCVNRGDVFAYMSANSRAGGIAGIAAYAYSSVNAFGGQMFYSFNYGRVSGGYASGIAAHMASDSNILKCGNFGEITGAVCASGLCSYVLNGYGSAETLAIKKSFNAGDIKLSETPPGNLENTQRIASPICTGVQNASLITVSNCYNDNTVFPCAINRGTDVTMSESFSVATEVFASGEPACVMNMYQDLPLPEEEGKTAKTYPDEKTERYVFRNRLYCCCNTTNINDKHVLSCTFSNASGDAVSDHTVGDDGYCSHCGADCRKPIITPETLPDATEREYYTVTFATDGTPTDELTYEIITSEADETAYELPNGLDIYKSSNQLEIYGSPNEYGTFTFTVKATNKYGSSYKTYTLIINQNTVPSFAITTKELPEGVVGEDYKCMLETNSKESVYWSITKGFELPSGLTLDEKTGLIYGIPEKEGSYKTSITAYCEKEEAQANFSLIISAKKSEYSLYYDGRTLFVICAKAGEYTLVFANYDKTGKMTDVKTLTQKFTQGENTIKALPDGVSLTSGDKIFLWENLSTLKPLCGAFAVK